MSSSTASAPSSEPCLTASNATLAGSAPSGPRTTVAPARAPQVPSCSAAAARNVSAAPSTTCRPPATSTRASFPVVVVLPVPFTPTISSTAGRPSCGRAWTERSSSGRNASVRTSRRSWRACAGGTDGAAGELDAQRLDQLARSSRGRGRPAGGSPRRLPTTPRRAHRHRAGRAGPARTRTGNGRAAPATGPAGPRAARWPRSGRREPWVPERGACRSGGRRGCHRRSGGGRRGCRSGGGRRGFGRRRRGRCGGGRGRRRRRGDRRRGGRRRRCGGRRGRRRGGSGAGAVPLADRGSSGRGGAGG